MREIGRKICDVDVMVTKQNFTYLLSTGTGTINNTNTNHKLLVISY